MNGRELEQWCRDNGMDDKQTIETLIECLDAAMGVTSSGFVRRQPAIEPRPIRFRPGGL